MFGYNADRDHPRQLAQSFPHDVLDVVSFVSREFLRLPRRTVRDWRDELDLGEYWIRL